MLVRFPLPKFPPLPFPALRGTPTTSFRRIPFQALFLSSFPLPIPLRFRLGFYFSSFTPLATKDHISVSIRSFFALFSLVSRFLELRQTLRSSLSSLFWPPVPFARPAIFLLACPLANVAGALHKSLEEILLCLLSPATVLCC